MRNFMEQTVLDKLKESIDSLDQSVSSALLALEKKQADPKKISRVHEYKTLIVTQKQYVTELETKILANDLSELDRLVSIINGISALIRDDAKCLAEEISGIKPELKGNVYDS
jgi:hypothetical protein